jgi:c-di-GMP-binding flagellar brake protein YcgR
MADPKRAFVINRELVVDILSPNGKTAVRASVAKVLRDDLWLKLFVDASSDSFFPKDAQVRLRFWDELGVYEAASFLREQRVRGFDRLLVARPSQVEIVQRREFFRVPVEIAFSAVIVRTVDERPIGVRGLAFVSKDLSGGGLRFLTDADFRRGDLLALVLYLGSTTQVGVEAKVCWSSTASEFGIKEYGLHFTRIDDADQDRVVSFLFDIQRRGRR